jgi:hypothetical protein
MDKKKFQQSRFAGGAIKQLVHEANGMRGDTEQPVDVSFAELIAARHEGLTIDSFYEEIGVDLGFDTIQNLFTTPDESIRWLVPEVFRDALRLGYRNAPIWPAVTAIEQQVSQLAQHLPYLNMSEAAPMKVGEGETIPVGTLSFGERMFRIYKFGRGIKVPDEVQRYVSLSVLSIFLQDFGVKMGQGVDTLAINTLINGEQASGANSSPVIGTANGTTLTFADLLKPWVRLAKMGRNPKVMISGEDTAISLLTMTEFATPVLGTPKYNLNVKTPLPQGADLYINGNISDNQLVIVDPAVALIKMNAVPLMVESERIVSNQTSAFYASFTTGFAKLFDDSAIIIDKTKTFAAYGFPTWFNVDADSWVIME